MRLQILTFFFCCVFCAFNLDAQEERPLRQYATQLYQQQVFFQNPSFPETLKAMEEQISAYGMQGDNRVDTIPVIFHVLYSPGEAYPDELQIQEQINALNRDFGVYQAPQEAYVIEKVSEEAGRHANPGVFFCLPPPDVTTAIRYIETPTANWKYETDEIKFSELGGDDAMDPTHFLNIWVGNLANNISGYAQLPGGPAKTDGIVLDTRFFHGYNDPYFLTYYGEGKSLTHLTGSYLGLYELWNVAQPCADDHVDDAPIHNVPNYHPGELSWHISLCDESMKAEMIMNFMDNTDDYALNMFTQGQKNRIKAVLSDAGLRNELKKGATLCKSQDFFSVDDRNRSLETAQNRFNLFPNPATGILNLQVQSASDNPESIQFSAFNMLGGLVWSSSTNTTDNLLIYKVDCSEWSRGGYIVRAVFGDGTAITQKVFVE